MRSQSYFVESQRVGELLSLHEISQGSLYQYRSAETAKKIVDNKEFRFTRADKFEDENEIAYGFNVLKDVAKIILSGKGLEYFMKILDALDESLSRCYVHCLSQDGKNQYLLDKYSDGETIIEFEESFPMIIYNCSWHAIGSDEEGYAIYYAVDHYKIHEGFVVYNHFQQEEIAIKICETFREMEKVKVHIVDQFHFIDSMRKFIILCKRIKFEKEKEYRVVLIANHDVGGQFEIKEGNRIYINLKVPPTSVNLSIIKVKKSK